MKYSLNWEIKVQTINNTRTEYIYIVIIYQNTHVFLFIYVQILFEIWCSCNFLYLHLNKIAMWNILFLNIHKTSRHISVRVSICEINSAIV